LLHKCDSFTLFKNIDFKVIFARKSVSGFNFLIFVNTVVDSDFESDDDQSTRRSGRRARRKNISYRDYDSDETEYENKGDESFHSSELSDSDFENKWKKRKDQKKESTSRKDKSSKGRRIKKIEYSSEEEAESTELEETEEETTPPPRKGKKPNK